jgi:hypothetical protein
MNRAPGGWIDHDRLVPVGVPLAITAAVVALAVVSWRRGAAGPEPATSAYYPPPAATATGQPAPPAVAAGGRVRLGTTGGGAIVLADPADFDALLDAQNAGDPNVRNLIAAGRAFAVAGGTEAVVTGTSFGAVDVYFEGSGKSGRVQRELVTPIP